MKKILICTIIFIILINIHAQINEVTVYADRALVSRSLKSNGKQGENQMLFKNVPLNIDINSLRTRGFTSAGGGLKILDIKPVKNYEKPITDQDKKLLQTKIEEKKDRLVILKANMERINQYKKNLDIFNIKLINENKDDLENGKLNQKQWEEASKYYERELERLDNDYFKINKEISMINDELKILDDQFKKYQNNNTIYTIDVVVTYSLIKDSNVEIILSYIVTGTYWYPVYDCRLNLDKKELIIEYHAKIRQNTGEDWNNVNLILSTARPDLSGIIPVINTWDVDSYERDYRTMEKKKYYGKNRAESGKDYTDEEELYSSVKEEKAEEYKAEIKSQGVSISYIIHQKVVIPSGNEETKVTISTGIELKPELSWAIVPRLDNNSFLKGRIKNISEFTFLEGEMNIFVNDSFIGKSTMNLINPNQEFELSLGRDPRINAEIKLDDINKGVKFGKKYEQRRYVITVSNNSNEDVAINIKDVIPRSIQPKKIIIKIIKLDPEPNKIDSESICNWDLTIKKNSKVVITEEWYIDYPDNQYIQGLD